jgi:benzoyl-CoA reductase/2-hydroxyglutaryl-CoA dehydratase subunit BcrC/BadD/HgdB
MTRKEYLIRQKEEKGRKLFGIFPAHYPKEILWAMNVLPVEIWDPPLEVSHANAHLQPYICSVVKLGLELILQGKCDEIDGFLFPHTCDSLQNLASMIYNYLDLNKPCYFFYHPKAPYRDASRQYYLDELKSLVLRLEKQLGALDPSELKQQVKQGQQVATLLRELYSLRAHGELKASNVDFYQIIRRGEYLHPDDFLPLLEEFLAISRGQVVKGPSVVLSGILPSPPDILKLLDEMGVRVADDDLLNCSRRLSVPTSKDEDPFEAMAENYFAMPPCTTKNSPLNTRVDYLFKKIEYSKAKGVIFYMVKFCETELFDVPQLVEELKKKGLATLAIDCELNQGLSGQIETRVEAFVEMII